MPLDAAVEGTAGVFQPVLTTILTTALAFTPMFVMSGLLGDFVYVIPLVVCLALAVSLVEITLALPAHLIAGLPNEPLRERHAEGWFDRLREGFGRFTHGVLRLRYAVIALFVLLLGSAFGSPIGTITPLTGSRRSAPVSLPARRETCPRLRCCQPRTADTLSHACSWASTPGQCEPGGER